MKKQNFLSDAEVLITGGAGFIGSNLAIKLIELGAHVSIIDLMLKPYGGNEFNLKDVKKKIHLIKGDIRSKHFMKEMLDGKDYVFHLAAQTGRIISMKNPKLDFSINCLGTLSVLEAIKKNSKKTKLIFASSRGVIGKPKYLPVDEKHQTYPKDIYGANKLLAEKYCFIFSHEYDIPVTILRFNNVYGPRCQVLSNHYGTINLFIAYALQGKILPIYGDGKQTRDYVYIDDVVNALIKSVDKETDGELFMVGTGKDYSLNQVVSYIKQELKNTMSKNVSYPKSLEKLDFSRFVSTFQKLNSYTGWKPTVSLKNGIRETVMYYKLHLKHYL